MADTLSCQWETLHSQQLRSIKKSIDSDHGIYRDHLGIRPIEKLRGLRLTRAAELVEAAVEETLSHYAFQTRNAPTTRVRVIDAGSDRMPLRPSGCGEPS